MVTDRRVTPTARRTRLRGDRARRRRNTRKALRRRRTLWLPGRWPVARLFVMEHQINVHDVRGVASPTADFGLPPVYEDKQLILVGGRARRFTSDELYGLGGDSAGLSDLREHTSMSESAIRRHAGKSLSVNLGIAMMTRSPSPTTPLSKKKVDLSASLPATFGRRWMIRTPPLSTRGPPSLF